MVVVVVVVVGGGGGGKGLLLGSHCDGGDCGQGPPRQPLFKGGCLKHGDMWNTYYSWYFSISPMLPPTSISSL
jgi:hypothetical protein